jgi:hypothetical protein
VYSGPWVKACMAAPDTVFDMKLPNKFYALIGMVESSK